MRMGGKEISFWNVAWFKKVGRHLCPFSVECWDVIHTNILSLIFCRMKANRILSHSHLGAGIFIPVLIRFPLVTLKGTNSNYWAGKRLPLITLKATNSNYRAGMRLPLITFYYLNGFFMSFHYPHYLKWEIITYKGNGAV